LIAVFNKLIILSLTTLFLIDSGKWKEEWFWEILFKEREAEIETELDKYLEDDVNVQSEKRLSNKEIIIN
jgi:hypothetical protein